LLTKVRLGVGPRLQLLIGTGLYFLGPYCREVSMMSDWMEYYIFFAIGDAITGFFFRPSTQQFLKNAWVFLLAIPVFALTQLHYLDNYYLNNGSVYYFDDQLGRLEFLPIVFIGCFSMFVLAFRLQIWNVLSFIRVLGFHSLQIYVMHVIVSAFVRTILTKYFGIFNPYVLLLSGIAAGVLIPVAVYNLLIKDNIGWFLFTPRKPRKSVAAEAAVQHKTEKSGEKALG
ncbi:MAG TPA: hypothetical protein VFR58_13860, partial [Flavisolibacter sp.]|nr:hypothetical protein [Flavisolibacter sp.]